jgi:hypothetical protein
MIPKLCTSGTVVCIGGGESLKAMKADIGLCRGRTTVIAINDAYLLAPWADVLYAADEKWWKWQVKDKRRGPLLAAFAGLRVSVDKKRARQTPPHLPGVIMLRNTGGDGLDLQPNSVRTGRNSGYQAINVAYHLGPRRILLVGYDMRGGHWFGRHPDNSRPNFHLCLQHFASLATAIEARGVDVINCTPNTALGCFRRMAWHDALAEVPASVAV